MESPTERSLPLPTVASRETWRAARLALLEKEKQLTRARDALNAERRALPMVEVVKPYVFEGPDGPLTLLDLFAGRRQLIVYHFMFDPTWEDGCPSCTAGTDELSPGFLEHLHTRDTSYAMVSRAPLAKLERWKAARGWDIPWYSSHGSDFNYDFGVTIDPAVKPPAYNFRSMPTGWSRVRCRTRASSSASGTACSTRTRATPAAPRGPAAHTPFLDLTPLGRQEPWEEPAGRAGSLNAARPDFAV